MNQTITEGMKNKIWSFIEEYNIELTLHLTLNSGTVINIKIKQNVPERDKCCSFLKSMKNKFQHSSKFLPFIDYSLCTLLAPFLELGIAKFLKHTKLR